GTFIERKSAICGGRVTRGIASRGPSAAARVAGSRTTSAAAAIDLMHASMADTPARLLAVSCDRCQVRLKDGHHVRSAKASRSFPVERDAKEREASAERMTQRSARL